MLIFFRLYYELTLFYRHFVITINTLLRYRGAEYNDNRFSGEGWPNVSINAFYTSFNCGLSFRAPVSKYTIMLSIRFFTRRFFLPEMRANYVTILK